MHLISLFNEKIKDIELHVICKRVTSSGEPKNK